MARSLKDSTGPRNRVPRVPGPYRRTAVTSVYSKAQVETMFRTILSGLSVVGGNITKIAEIPHVDYPPETLRDLEKVYRDITNAQVMWRLDTRETNPDWDIL